jgi:hypothetical protein
MINNFDKIKNLLVFGKDTYYFAQILRRRKDPGNEGMKSNTERKWFKFITKPETFDNIQQEIQELCRIYNARAYIEINPRSLEKFSVVLAKKLLDRIYVSDYRNIFSVQNQVALLEDTIKTKGVLPGRRWLVDVDVKTDIPIVEKWLEENNIKIVETIPTFAGAHIIVESFNYKALGIDFEKDIKLENAVFNLKPQCNTLLFY